MRERRRRQLDPENDEQEERLRRRRRGRRWRRSLLLCLLSCITLMLFVGFSIFAHSPAYSSPFSDFIALQFENLEGAGVSFLFLFAMCITLFPVLLVTRTMLVLTLVPKNENEEKQTGEEKQMCSGVPAAAAADLTDWQPGMQQESVCVFHCDTDGSE